MDALIERHEAEAAAPRLLNLTERRIEILRWLASRESPVFVCAIANNCVPRPLCNGKPLHYWPQQATRTGAGAVRPLAQAGLVRVRCETYGWGKVQISEEGRRVLSSLDRDDGTLEARLIEARQAAKPKGYYWWITRP